MDVFQIWLERTLRAINPVAAFMHSKWGWPAAESVHFLGLSLLIGCIGLFDLRLLGLAKRIPIGLALTYASAFMSPANASQANHLAAQGLVTWVKPASEIDAFVSDLARRLAAGPPVAIAQSKGLLNDGVDATLREALANEARAQLGNFATADSIAAYAAFADNREPTFTGQWAVTRSE